ncbi:hypothetical protein GALMADRAFT_224841 [Galerina marginata CBS 339.88]|uniref:Uncharacterized protein n=1 Tax=Galerina marginata (strain CBS 339.88) TaxID=685588 RepID=A0A067T328_GALM3|nr:hypothetical protein GALMADRAFT_224841 [Galerina marginata CBS 339.88]
MDEASQVRTCLSSTTCSVAVKSCTPTHMNTSGCILAGWYTFREIGSKNCYSFFHSPQRNLDWSLPGLYRNGIWTFSQYRFYRRRDLAVLCHVSMFTTLVSGVWLERGANNITTSIINGLSNMWCTFPHAMSLLAPVILFFVASSKGEFAYLLRPHAGAHHFSVARSCDNSALAVSLE